MRKFLNLIPTVLLIFSCTPAASSAPQEIVVDGFAIKPGQKWEIKAWGGQDWKDDLIFIVGDEFLSNTYFKRYKSPVATIQYFNADSSAGYPVDSLSFNWRSTFAELQGQTVFCALRDPKLKSQNPPTFEGRWIASMKRSEQYGKTGDTTGTGACTVTLVQE